MLSFLIIFSCQNLSDNVFDSSNAQDEFKTENFETDKIFLRLKPEFGQKINYELQLKLRPNRGIIPLNTEVISNMNLRSTNQYDSFNVFHVDFQRLRMSTDLMGAKVNYDSQTGENSLPKEMTSEFEKLLAKKLVMSVDSLGQILSLRMNEDNFETESSNINLNAIFLSFPPHKIGVGDAWVKSQTLFGLGEVEVQFRLDKITDTEVLIKISASEKSQRIFDVEGQYWLDRKTGLSTKGELNVEDKSRKIGVKINLNSFWE